ncbi:tail fiber assembly protein [Siccibacter turicensis]|uniref:tail fiber assembly protein n=1 Tax=Siccibacter turicensis TaxID=357233 RepID=UPI0023F0B93C|nr:tail fiber assembly protein [Siccibacter turicensis]
MYYSEQLKGFMPDAWKNDGTYKEWPDDAIQMTEEEIELYWTKVAPAGKMLGTVDGRLAWVDLPPLSREELLYQAEEKKAALIREANDYMNSKQWPGKAALGRMKDTEKAQYIMWLDYLDALEMVDTSTALDVTWPTPPVSASN